MIHFVGAGCGAPDLITLRGKKHIENADVIIYAGSLVNKDLLQYARKDCAIYDSSKMTLEEIIGVIEKAEHDGLAVVRLHTGDPSLYGAIAEQMQELERLGIKYDITPGVSAFSGAASTLKAEYTQPDVSQTVIITRAAGRTGVPGSEDLRSLASHGATMVLYLSAGLLDKVSADLIAGGYEAATPAAIVYKATWPEEKVCRCTLGTLKQTAEENGISNTALIVVGDFLKGSFSRSCLYNPGFSTGFREAKE